MKTLDEVIECLEDPSEVYEGQEVQTLVYNEDVTAALNYLYEYRSVKHLQEIWQQEAENCKEVRERFTALYKEYQERINAIEPRNDPLTWDELKLLQGKPIWIETDEGEKGWWLIQTDLSFGYFLAVDSARDRRDFHVSEQDLVWKAYRKEWE